jgi:predicted molibdopterin-dependent oxidoreductase YjgC
VYKRQQYTRSLAAYAKDQKKSFEGNLEDLKSADSVMILDEDLSKDHQVAGFFIKRVLASSVKLLVVDSQENGLGKFANKYLRLTKGSRGEALLALSAATAKLGVAKGKTKANVSDLKSLAEKTGLTSDDYLDAAFVIASSEHPVIIYKDGADIESIHAFAELINAKMISVKGNANSLASSLLGVEKSLDLQGKKVLFVANGDEELSQKSIKELEKIPFKAIQSAYASSLTSIADVVLPSTDWLEQEGHYISAEGVVNFAKRSLVPAEDVLSPFETLNRLAEKLGVKLDDEWTKLVHDRVSPVELSK